MTTSSKKKTAVLAAEHTAYRPHVGLISPSFYIPQLKVSRRIWALLPHDYFEGERRYPVLYLQDAQNLFHEHAPFGHWNIDGAMTDLSRAGKDFIVIAIDHGGKDRISEYSPYYHREFGEGRGAQYASFVIDTLKPFVDIRLRTMSDRDHTGIGGSSMGGLISAYMGLVYAETFGKVMIFSPSFWYSDEIYFDAFNHRYTHPSRLFLYGGEKESDYMKRHLQQFQLAVSARKYEGINNDWRVEINPDGEHTESDWAEVFPKAVGWLFFES